MEQMPARDGESDRRVLDVAGADLFQEVLEAGLLAADDPRCGPGHPDHVAVRLLLELGLLQHDNGLGGYVVADPSVVQAAVAAPLSRQATSLLSESAAWAETLAPLAQLYRRAQAEQQQLFELRGMSAINRYLEALVDDAHSELLTAQPRGARSPDELDLAHNRDIRALMRGVRMQTLYQHTARSSRGTRDYVSTMLSHGAQVRTLDEFFNRLIIVDRRVAVVPATELAVALAVTSPTLVAYLVDLFERSWERGKDYEPRPSPKESDIADDVRQLTVRMLTEGHSDSASAKRVGVSTRTYATYVAALKQEYGVETRFQLGLAMGRQRQADVEPG